MTTSPRTPLLLLLLLIAALGLAACGGSDGTSSDTSAVGGDVVGGGEAVCDQATFEAWVKGYGEGNGTTATLPADGFQCADGWAVLTPTLDDGEGGGETETVLVQAEGGVWALMDREMACGTDEASAQVPASLYEAACQTS